MWSGLITVVILPLLHIEEYMALMAGASGSSQRHQKHVPPDGIFNQLHCKIMLSGGDPAFEKSLDNLKPQASRIEKAEALVKT